MCCGTGVRTSPHSHTKKNKQTNKCDFKAKQTEKNPPSHCRKLTACCNVLSRSQQPAEKAGLPASALGSTAQQHNPAPLSNTGRFQNRSRHLIKDMGFEVELHLSVKSGDDRKLQCRQGTCLKKDLISFSSYRFIPS